MLRARFFSWLRISQNLINTVVCDPVRPCDTSRSAHQRRMRQKQLAKSICLKWSTSPLMEFRKRANLNFGIACKN